MAFLDGIHENENVLCKSENVQKYQILGDVIIFDDNSIKMYLGVVKAMD
tara:strand:- start:1253 stop:1399 length:147 start_codon:yes stop_codon:yes gene_type:complete